MDQTLVAFTSAVLRKVFPDDIALVGDGQLYRVISEDVVLTQPDIGRPFDLDAAVKILTVAAPFVPVIVEIIKAMKPEKRQSTEKVTETVLIIVADRPEAASLRELRPQALEHLVSRCASAVLKNLERL